MEILKNIMADRVGVGGGSQISLDSILSFRNSSKSSGKFKSIEKSSGKIKELIWRCWKFFWKAPSVL